MTKLVKFTCNHLGENHFNHSPGDKVMVISTQQIHAPNHPTAMAHAVNYPVHRYHGTHFVNRPIIASASAT